MSDPVRSQGSAHAPRPTDLVALVTFDGEVYENQAVTRERLASPNAAPHPLNAAIQQWLGLKRHTWIDVRGRQIDGIATAHELGSRRAWLIDTLVDASTGEREDVITALLHQAVRAAVDARVTHLLLRTRAGAPAQAEAMRTGFKLALAERLWSGDRLGRADGAADGAADADLVVREATGKDAHDLFRLYNRTLPIDCRQALALTLTEWQAVQERRWLGRGGVEYVAVDGEGVRAALRLAPGGEVAQFDLIADARGMNGAASLLDAARGRLDAERVLALVPQCAGSLEPLLRGCGLAPGDEYALMSRRTARPQRERSRVAAGMAVSRG